MRQREHHGKRTVKQKIQRVLRYVHVLKKGIEHAVAAENRLPRVSAHQVAHPQRNDHELVQEVFALSGTKREIVRQRISEQE